MLPIHRLPVMYPDRYRHYPRRVHIPLSVGRAADRAAVSGAFFAPGALSMTVVNDPASPWVRFFILIQFWQGWTSHRATNRDTVSSPSSTCRAHLALKDSPSLIRSFVTPCSSQSVTVENGLDVELSHSQSSGNPGPPQSVERTTESTGESNRQV